MTGTSPTIAVVPATVIAEAIQLADGRVVAVELSQPRDKFTIVLENAGEVEVVAMHDSQEDAIETAQRLEAQLRAMARAPAGETLQ